MMLWCYSRQTAMNWEAPVKATYRTLLGSFVLLFGCSLPPLQGYPGPELPKEQVAFVGGLTNSTNEKILELSVNNVQFAGRDITVLPGTHRLQMRGGIGSQPRNCFDADEVDHSSFDSCLNTQREQIRTKSSYVQDCELKDHIKEKQVCQRDYDDYRCELSVKLDAGAKYKLGFYDSLGTAKFYCDLDRGEDIGEQRKQVAEGKCRKLGTQQVQERFDGHFY
jgi:hypothetical protein